MSGRAEKKRGFAPDAFYKDVIAIPPSLFVGEGIKGVILDIDNTLREDGAESIRPETVDWLQALWRQGLGLCLLSNSRSARVAELGKRLGLPHVGNARKPSAAGYIKAMDAMGTTRHETAMVGDQLFSDILGGNRLGLYTVLVEPVNRKTEPFVVKLKRPFEKLVFRQR